MNRLHSLVVEVLSVLVTATVVGLLTVVCIAAIDGGKEVWTLASWFWWKVAARVFAVAVLWAVFSALAGFTRRTMLDEDEDDAL